MNKPSKIVKHELNYDKEKYKIWDWRKPMILHWVINPALAINELILGQTIPKVMLIERHGDKPFFQRTLVPCPLCGEMHTALKFSGQNKTSFKNWFGLYCDKCHGIIPVKRNATSLIILGLTYPVWGWFKPTLKQKWLANQPKRFKNLNTETIVKIQVQKNWLKSGLYFGLFMFASVGIYAWFKGMDLSLKQISRYLVLHLIMGLAWGATMKWWMNKKGKRKNT